MVLNCRVFNRSNRKHSDEISALINVSRLSTKSTSMCLERERPLLSFLFRKRKKSINSKGTKCETPICHFVGCLNRLQPSSVEFLFPLPISCEHVLNDIITVLVNSSWSNAHTLLQVCKLHEGN